jgi:myo-inositol-1(or 4)-monophosphatase
MTDHWAELTDFALSLARASGAAILPHFRRNAPIDVKVHEAWDPVTEGDRAGERAIRDLIEKHHPSHGIIGEEFGSKTGTSGLTWILDPVDGTRAFISGLPTWGTLIALYEEGVPRIGLMHQPFTGEIFFGNPGGAWLDHRGQRNQLHVRQNSSLAEALAGTTSPYLFKNNDAEPFERLQRKTKLMRFGGDCYFFAMVAAGHLDLALDPATQIYDVAGLIPIITGAGGHIGSWTDNDPAKGGNILAASSQKLLEEAKAVMTGTT